MFKHRKGDFTQMRKNIERIIGLTLCMGMLAGCAQTPESSLVRQKGNKALDSYKEADDKDVNMAGNASSADQTTASESTGTSDTAASTDVHPDNASAARTTIRDLINAPETYKSQVTDDTSKLVVNTDAAGCCWILPISFHHRYDRWSPPECLKGEAPEPLLR